mmetsp:Transcript_19684/g.45933  ORF Transcript_19684/g.45933 Transcript_19684/m.45933 type:complete len:404 (+) Transcript_19684:84-1295(+)|eukprot:CAMPEP_0178403052 /NCGR_PEP_ID=MMETSP0689_2-20121128/17168_1 /TAXON_ID=160604 /ORGANISM="Amphidinium massartii, Strain CS-259" /LENGTH=403 /DNA_ID=CAMNT_0020023991 /DNA_START=69 /DNA_END=1280 /DNA_ORIENTATION=-
MASVGDRLVFPAPPSTYTRETLKRYLCWIPWNEAVSPDKVDDERYAEGIPCMWLPAPRAAGVILFCHGNAEDLGMSFAFLRHMRDQFKMNVFAIEYPGYGLLNYMDPSEAAIKEVVLTAFRFVLDELKVAYEQIILFGRSIGSGPSIYLASRFPVGGLILVAAFASIREVIKSLAGGLVARAFDERFPNLALIGNVSCPTLFIHGEKDSLVPPSHSVSLFKQCRARKLLITPPSMEHNTNLFTDASYLAVPAINFFGLPGYQQDTPPQVPAQFFEDGRKAFRARKHAKRKLQMGKDGQSTTGSDIFQEWPWFIFCGCPTNRGYKFQGDTLSRSYEWELESRIKQHPPDSTRNADFWSSDLNKSADKDAQAVSASRERWQHANNSGKGRHNFDRDDDNKMEEEY